MECTTLFVDVKVGVFAKVGVDRPKNFRACP